METKLASRKHASADEGPVKGDVGQTVDKDGGELLCQ